MVTPITGFCIGSDMGRQCYETSRCILLDKNFFQYHDKTLLIRVYLPYFSLFGKLTFKNSFEQQDVSYL